MIMYTVIMKNVLFPHYIFYQDSANVTSPVADKKQWRKRMFTIGALQIYKYNWRSKVSNNIHIDAFVITNIILMCVAAPH